jgi:hypothetical protein
MSCIFLLRSTGLVPPFPCPSNKPSVECKMMPAGEDYVPMRISCRNRVTGTYWRGRLSGSANRCSGDICTSHCRSCIFGAPQLKRERSLLCGFEEIRRIYRDNADGIRSCWISQFESHMASHAVGLRDETQREKADIYVGGRFCHSRRCEKADRASAFRRTDLPALNRAPSDA